MCLYKDPFKTERPVTRVKEGRDPTDQGAILEEEGVGAGDSGRGGTITLWSRGGDGVKVRGLEQGHVFTSYLQSPTNSRKLTFRVLNRYSW